jgi:hypothetical protein
MDVFLEVVITDKKSRKVNKSLREVRAGELKVLPEKGMEMTVDRGEKQDNQEHTIYAYRLAASKAADSPFPAGKRLRAHNIQIIGASIVGLLASPHGTGPFLAASALYPGRTITQIHDRIVHPLYQLRPDDMGLHPPDADKLVKLTRRIIVIPKKD